MTKPRPFGHYFILEKIAQGGMAEIFKGLTYDFSGLKKFIVIKRILPHIAANEDFIRMLVDEAKIAVRLNHGNIAQTFDLGKVAEDYFIVMEYVEGRTVSQIFKKAISLKEPIPIPMVTYIVGEICHGLDYIHRRSDEGGQGLGIVHCDISPQNIIVSESGTVKIVDFGVAKAAFKLSEKDRGVLKGKFAYMSPEQTEGIYVDARSDIFSTGVLLWEALTGRRLFKKKSNTETIEAVNTMTIYPPSAYRNEIPSQLDEVVIKALERDPKKRFASASDMALALTKFNLQHYPDFKSAGIGDFLGKLFEDEENTGDIFQEKTQHEEVTLLDEDMAGMQEIEEEHTPAEDTVIIDPQELDFHSVFEDIEMDEVSEVTQAISLSPDREAASPQEEMEPTGDLPEEIPPSAQDLVSSSRRRNTLGQKAMIALGGVLLAIGIYLIAIMLFSPADATLILVTDPPDARVYLDGKEIPGDSPLEINDLKPRRDYELILEAPGYISEKHQLYLFPHWTKNLQIDMKRKKGGVLEVDSQPPGAALYLDGQMTGMKTPVLLEAAKLKFPLVLGLSKGGPPQWTQMIPVAPRKNLKIHANLNASFSYLDIRSNPPGAEVFLGAKRVGKTPLYSMKVPSEEGLALRFELSGFRTYQKNLRLKPGRHQSLNVVLQK
ncbi:MAG: serine/threonine-protein kinase [bacterium]|nr:serine/threonine-protein kinase [bacterium]